MIRFKKDDGSEYPEWNKKKWGSVGQFLKSGNLSKIDLAEEGIPCILYGELYTKYNEIANSIYSKTSSSCGVLSKKGDVIIPKSGETPEDISTATCIPYDGVALGGDLIIFRSSNILGAYLSYLVANKKKREIAKIAQGKTIVHISEKSLAKIEIEVPCIEEQQKIVDFLSSVDEIILLQEEEISVLEEQKKGVMQKLFNCEVRFKADDGSAYPEWERKQLKDNFEKVIDNRGKTPPLSDNGYPLIEISAVGNFFVNYDAIVKYVDEGTFHTWFRNHLKKGDILFSTVGTTAMCSYYDEKKVCCVAQNIVGLRFDNNCDSRFMFYFLSEEKNNRYIKSIQMNGVQPSIKVTQFIKLFFSFPCLGEQQKIADCLSAYDEAIQIKKEKLGAWKEIRKGVLQQMFV